MSPRPEPATLIADIESSARVLRTPCGDGHMAWHVWGDGPPMVLLHGGHGSWTHWIRNIATLSRHFTLFAADLPGLGASDLPPGPQTPESIAAVVAEGIGHLVPDTRPHLVGFSFGGLVAGIVAGPLRQRIADLTLIGVSSLGLPGGPRAPFRKPMPGMAEAEIAAVHRHNLSVLMIADQANIDELAVHLQTRNIGQARFHSRPFASTDTLVRALAGVTVPVRAIWGTRDVTAKPSIDARTAVLRSAQPGLTVRLVPDAGHWVMYETPTAFDAALLGLLADASTAGP